MIQGIFIRFYLISSTYEGLMNSDLSLIILVTFVCFCKVLQKWHSASQNLQSVSLCLPPHLWHAIPGALGALGGVEVDFGAILFTPWMEFTDTVEYSWRSLASFSAARALLLLLFLKLAKMLSLS